MMDGVFWNDLKVDWTDEEFRRKFCNTIWKMGYEEGLRVAKMPGNQ